MAQVIWSNVGEGTSPLQDKSSSRMARNDRELARRFEDIVAAYEKRIFNTILRIVADRDEAADLTQETFVKAFAKFGSFRGDASINTWLTSIAVNACRNRIRDRTRRKRYEAFSLDGQSNADEPGFQTEPFSREPNPAFQLEMGELRELVEAAIASLPPEFRIPVVLRDVEEMSYKEIAEICQISLENVKTRIFRGRSEIRRQLAPYLKGSLGKSIDGETG